MENLEKEGGVLKFGDPMPPKKKCPSCGEAYSERARRRRAIYGAPNTRGVQRVVGHEWFWFYRHVDDYMGLWCRGEACKEPPRRSTFL